MESNQHQYEFSEENITMEAIQAMSLEAQQVQFNYCKIVAEGWSPIIKTLSQKQKLTSLTIRQGINSITQIRLHSVKNKSNNSHC